MSFGKIFREHRQKNGITLKAVAEAAGVTVSFISDVENGHRRVSKHRIVEKMALALFESGDPYVNSMIALAWEDFEEHNHRRWYEQL